MAQTKNINVLMVSLPYQGHINPMTRFAELLASKGLNVTIATIEYARNRFQNPNPDHIEFEYFSDGLELEFDREKNLDIVIDEYLPSEGAKNLSSLISNLEEKGKVFSSIIINCFVPWVANVATTHKIPCALLWIQSCATYGIYYHYFKKISAFPTFDDPDGTVQISEFPSMKFEDLPTFLHPSSPIHFLNLLSVTVDTLDKLQWVFGTSFYDIEDSLVDSMAKFKPILPIGPLVPPRMLEEKCTLEGEYEDACMSWLHKQDDSSVIYIALGSISVMTEVETRALANVLESDVSIRFLWVIRKNSEKGWGRKMGDLTQGFLETTKDRGLVVSWCEQDKVLMHPSIKLFLTHCGWNSSLEAITAGVPIIAYPDWTDQTTNAKLLVDVLNMGVRMRKNENGELEKEEVERCIFEVNDGPRAAGFKEQAIKWKEAAKKARSIGGDSDLIIDKFIAEINGNVI